MPSTTTTQQQHRHRPTSDAPARSASGSGHDIPVVGESDPRRQQEAPAAKEQQTKKLLPGDKPTRAAVWCGAALCLAFSLLLIAAGVVTVVVFVVIRPRQPQFDAAGATLNSIYIDSPAYLNGDLAFLANFSNPNRKIDVRFEHVTVELYFRNTLLAVQALQPFSLRRGEVRLESVHMVSSEVYLTPELAQEMQGQVITNRVVYSIRGTFKVRGSLGVIHFTYWLYGRCAMELARPPSGVLMAKTCRTGK